VKKPKLYSPHKLQALERVAWFHFMTKAKEFPNATTFALQFRISQRTAARDIQIMQLKMKAPLKYVAGKRGYRYARKFTLDEGMKNLINRRYAKLF
jgi:hypothetical protein